MGRPKWLASTQRSAASLPSLLNTSPTAPKSEECVQAVRKFLQQRQQARKSSMTCPTPSEDQQLLEVRMAEALEGLVPARSSIATEGTVQTELAIATRRRRTRWRTMVTSRGPSSPKPKIISTAAERCTTCII